MLNFNKTKDDILVENLLQDLQRYNPKKFQYHNVLTREKNWDGLKGRLDAKMLKDTGFWEPADHVFFFVCGPPAFDAHCKKVLAEMGFVAGVNFTE